MQLVFVSVGRAGAVADDDGSRFGDLVGRVGEMEVSRVGLALQELVVEPEGVDDLVIGLVTTRQLEDEAVGVKIVVVVAVGGLEFCASIVGEAPGRRGVREGQLVGVAGAAVDVDSGAADLMPVFAVNFHAEVGGEEREHPAFLAVVHLRGIAALFAGVQIDGRAFQLREDVLGAVVAVAHDVFLAFGVGPGAGIGFAEDFVVFG